MRGCKGALLAVALGLWALSACKPGAQEPVCQPECLAGSTCDEELGKCIPVALAAWEGSAPGRAVRMVPDGTRVALAAIDPATARLVVGTATPTEREFHILHQFVRVAGRRLAMDASRSHVALAWVDRTGQYRVAVRPVGAANDSWQAHAVDVVDATGVRAFEGSDHFDVAWSSGSDLSIVFFDARRRTLRRLVNTGFAPSFAGEWRLEEVDDGQQWPPASDCPRELRPSRRQGVGWDPDLLHRDGDWLVAYHDADCGDLRLARHEGGNWQVELVASGTPEPDSAARQIVGRQPSMALDPWGRLSVAYHHVSRGQMMVARHDGLGWRQDLVDAGRELDAHAQQRKQLVGAFPQLRFDDQGTAQLVYFNATRNHLRVARRQVGAPSRNPWTQRTLGEAAPVGFFTSAVWRTDLGLVIAAEKLVPQGPGKPPASRLMLSWQN